MTKYNLQSVTTVDGIYSIAIFSEFVGLTIPVGQSIVSIGENTETADRDVSRGEFSTLDLSLIDDYTVYSEGFWYKVLSGELHFRIYLNEGAGDTFFYFGQAQDEATRWSEKSLISGKLVRTVEISLVSAGKILFDTPIPDWIAAVYANRQATALATPTNIHSVISVLGMFSAMLSASGLNPSYAENHTSFVYGEADLLFTNDNDIADLRVDQLYIPVTYDSGVGELTSNYWNSANPDYLGDKFATLGAILKDLMDNFGVFLRMTYDITFEEHNIRLIQRGRAYPNSEFVLFSNREITSEIVKSQSLVGDAAKATKNINADQRVWFSKKYSPTFTTIEPPNYVEFDVEMTVLFWVLPSANIGLGDAWALYGTPGTLANLANIKDVSYYKYLPTPGYVVASAATNELKMMEAIAGYQYHKFINLFTQFNRTYKTMKGDIGAGDTHTALSIMRRTQINDGQTTRPFFINRVTKNGDDSIVEIEWFLDGTIVDPE